MSGRNEGSYAGTWGCLGVGMVLAGAFLVWLFRSIGTAQHEYEHTAAGLLVGGVAILLARLAVRLRA